MAAEGRVGSPSTHAHTQHNVVALERRAACTLCVCVLRVVCGSEPVCLAFQYGREGGAEQARPSWPWLLLLLL